MGKASQEGRFNRALKEKEAVLKQSGDVEDWSMQKGQWGLAWERPRPLKDLRQGEWTESRESLNKERKAGRFETLPGLRGLC